MTMTDSLTATVAEPQADVTEAPLTAPSEVESQPTGFFAVISTTDHKRIGSLWLWSAMVFLVGMALVSFVLRVEDLNGDPENIFAGFNNYFQFFSLYRLGMVLLVVVPLFVGLATVIVPMQVGATNIAFPRAAHSALWLFLIGAGITLVSAVSVGGWGAIDGVSAGEADAIALTLVGTALVIGSLLLASVCIATTVVAMRTAGMTLLRVPVFSWSMLVACSVWLLTLPVALGNLVLIYFDLRGGPGVFGIVEGSDAIFSQLVWLVDQPQIFAWAIPVLGVLGQIVPVVAKRRAFSHELTLVLIGLFGLLAVGAWSQPWFGGADYDEHLVYIGFGLFAALPVLGSLGLAVATLLPKRGTSSATKSEADSPTRAGLAELFTVHGVGAFVAGLLLLAAATAGLVRVLSLGVLGDRTTVTAVMNLVLFSSVLAGIVGIWFWAPKIGRGLLPVGLGHFGLANVGIGALLLGGADFINGFLGSTDLPANVMVWPRDGSLATSLLRELPSTSYQTLVDGMNLLAVLGAFMIVVGLLVVVVAVARSGRVGDVVADNPFGGVTLEWATSSPPPVGNFAEPPDRVISEAPLLDSLDEPSEGS